MTDYKPKFTIEQLQAACGGSETYWHISDVSWLLKDCMYYIHDSRAQLEKLKAACPLDFEIELAALGQGKTHDITPTERECILKCITFAHALYSAAVNRSAFSRSISARARRSSAISSGSITLSGWFNTTLSTASVNFGLCSVMGMLPATAYSAATQDEGRQVVGQTRPSRRTREFPV